MIRIQHRFGFPYGVGYYYPASVSGNHRRFTTSHRPDKQRKVRIPLLSKDKVPILFSEGWLPCSSHPPRAVFFGDRSRKGPSLGAQADSSPMQLGGSNPR